MVSDPSLYLLGSLALQDEALGCHLDFQAELASLSFAVLQWNFDKRFDGDLFTVYGNGSRICLLCEVDSERLHCRERVLLISHKFPPPRPLHVAQHLSTGHVCCRKEDGVTAAW